MEISSSALSKLKELIKKGEGPWERLVKHHDFELGVYVGNIPDAYDNKRGPDGENVFSVVKEGGWKIGVMPIDPAFPAEAVAEHLGIKFIFFNNEYAFLDFVEGRFHVDGIVLEAI